MQSAHFVMSNAECRDKLLGGPKTYVLSQKKKNHVHYITLCLHASVKMNLFHDVCVCVLCAVCIRMGVWHLFRSKL